MASDLYKYTTLLHLHRSPDAREVKEFYKAHETDPVFVRRADVLNKLSLAKSVPPVTTRKRP